MRPQPQQKGMFDDMRTAGNLLTWICHSMAVTVEVFLHDQFGERYLGAQSFFGLLAIMGSSLFCGRQDTRALLGFLVAYIIVCSAIRIETAIRRRKGTLPAHSRYNGRPFLMRLMRRTPEIDIKQRIEPLLVLFVGIGVLPYSQPLGGYLMAAAIALAASVGMTEAQQRIRAMDMNDAVISQTDVAERFRDMNRR
jgi:hypothetical protein